MKKRNSGALLLSGRRWRRFWLLVVPAVASAGVVLAGISQGALAASVAASGDAFKVSGDRLEGDGFTAMPSVSTEPGGRRHTVLVVTARHARLSNLCVSVLVRTPVGRMTVLVNAGTTHPVSADGLSVDAGEAFGDLQLTGVSARALSDPAVGFNGDVSHLVAVNPRFTGWRGAAGSFHLSDVSVRLKAGDHECF